ncbi:hypothetical protein [Veillonella caviae]|uniref:hypothetical protein n=1 Tax=Veillonella caviae TaxID=248316 RepID=UPI002A91D2B5|nr:hypothetical protein [Veillonella caviae]MDY5787096.1 hypothetical protein [Veillonella caviae]
MEYIETAVIDTIRDGLIHQYDKDQQMQQLIEEIGAEAGLSEQELVIVYQAYLEIKERMQYTANLVELWNQIEVVQHRMSLLHSYDNLEHDLLGDDMTETSERNTSDLVDIADTKSKEEIKFNIIDVDKQVSMVKKEKKSAKEKHHRSKKQKKIDKLLKKQMKRIEKEWAKISGKLTKGETSSKSKEEKAAKKAAKKAEKTLAKEKKAAKKASKKAAKQEIKGSKESKKLKKKKLS